MKKYFVLDSNVLLYDPESIFKFEDNFVIIPITVIEEINKFKRDLDEVGRNARQVTRYLDRLRSNGNLSEGVKLESGGIIKVVGAIDRIEVHDNMDRNINDNIILSAALNLKKKNKNPVIFITKDINLRIKADAYGLKSVDFEEKEIEKKEEYSGCLEIETEKDLIDEFYKNGYIEKSKVYDDEVYINQFITVKEKNGGSGSFLAKYNSKTDNFEELKLYKNIDSYLTPKNREQIFATELLLDDKIQLVTLSGKAGTGKTLLAIATGLRKTRDERIYKKLLISRPVIPLGKEIGFLPGSIEEKLTPWMQPIYDNLEFLLSHNNRSDKMYSYNELIEYGILEIEALSFIRGRSIPRQFFVIDEAQNLTPHEVKTVISRAGFGTKIVLTGDPSQIDSPYLDFYSNGLIYTIEKFKNIEVAGHITLVKGERSPLAELAADLL